MKGAGGQAKWAEANGVSAAYVSDCLNLRREIGEGIAKPLGYQPATMYVAWVNKGGP